MQFFWSFQNQQAQNTRRTRIKRTFSGGGRSFEVVIETGVLQDAVTASPRLAMVADFLKVSVAVGIFDWQCRNIHVVTADVQPRTKQLKERNRQHSVYYWTTTRKPSCRGQTRATLEIRATGHSRASKVTPFDSFHMVSYYRSIVTLCLKCTVFEISRHIGRKSRKNLPHPHMTPHV